MLNTGIVPATVMLLTCILKTHQLLKTYMQSPIIGVPLPLTPKKLLSPNKTVWKQESSGEEARVLMSRELWSLSLSVPVRCSLSPHPRNLTYYVRDLLRLDCIALNLSFYFNAFRGQPAIRG